MRAEDKQRMIDDFRDHLVNELGHDETRLRISCTNRWQLHVLYCGSQGQPAVDTWKYFKVKYYVCDTKNFPEEKTMEADPNTLTYPLPNQP